MTARAWVEKMIVRISVRIVTALAVALLANLSAQAQQAPSRLDEIVKRGTLRVGMTGDYKPFTYLDKTTQQFSGFDVDMAESLGKALGVKVEYVATAWPKLMNCLLYTSDAADE